MTTAQISSQASRMRTEDTIKTSIRRSQREADALQILLDLIPWDDLSIESEGLLWSYFISK